MALFNWAMESLTPKGFIIICISGDSDNGFVQMMIGSNYQKLKINIKT